MAIKYLDAKRIRGSSTGSATATFESDFTSTTGWTQNSSGTQNIAISTGNDRVDYDTTSSGGEDSTLVYDLGAGNVSDTAWVLRGKSVITTYTAGSSSSCHLFVGLSDENHTSNHVNAQDSISFAIGVGTNDDNYYIASGNATSMYGGTNHGYPDGNGGGVMTHVPTEETVYFELIRTSSAGVTLNLFTDAGFSTPVSNGSYSVLFSSSSTTTPPTGFRYLVFKARDRSIASNECQGYIQDLQFYNGVTVATTDEKATLLRDDTTDATNVGITKLTASGTSLPSTLAAATPDAYSYSGSGVTDINKVPLDFSGYASFTMAFWLKPDAFDGKYLWRTNQAGSAYFKLMFYEWGAEGGNPAHNVRFEYYSGTTAYDVRTNLDADEWVNLVIVKDTSTIRLYIDGALIDTQASIPSGALTENTSTGGWWLFADEDNTSMSYEGDALQFLLYDTALTLSQIQTIYNSGNGTNEPSTTDLVLWYNFQQATSGKLENQINETKIPENTLFDETDTYKTWWLQSSAWKLGAIKSPSSISDLYAWYDPSDETTITESSNRVSKIENKEGTTARDLLQSTGGDQPLWVSSGRNSLGVLDFDDDRWLQTASALPEISQPVTIFIVLETPAGNSGQRWWYNSHSDVAQNFATYSNENANGFSMLVDNRLDVSFAAGGGVWQYVTSRYNTTASDLRMNGVEKVSGTVGTDGFRGFLLGAWAYNGNWIETQVAEIIIYNKLLSNAEVDAVEDYLKDKWGF